MEIVKSPVKMMLSTIESLKILASSKKLKSAYIDTRGKVGKTTSPSELLKNCSQATYARNLMKKYLNLLQILEMIYCQLFKTVKKWGEVCERSASEGIAVIPPDI